MNRVGVGSDAVEGELAALIGQDLADQLIVTVV